MTDKTKRTWCHSLSPMSSDTGCWRARRCGRQLCFPFCFQRNWTDSIRKRCSWHRCGLHTASRSFSSEPCRSWTGKERLRWSRPHQDCGSCLPWGLRCLHPQQHWVYCQCCSDSLRCPSRKTHLNKKKKPWSKDKKESIQWAVTKDVTL